MAYKQWGKEQLLSAEVDQYLMRQAFIVCTSGTRPSSPPNGMRIWETDTGEERYWNGSVWKYHSELALFVRKISNETINNSASLSNDDELFLTLRANTFYLIDIYLVYTSTATADVTVGIYGASGIAGSFYTGSSLFSAAGNPSQSLIDFWLLNSITNTRDLAGYGTSSPMIMSIREMLIRTGTAGTFGVRWAQRSAEASNTTIRANSYLFARRMFG